MEEQQFAHPVITIENVDSEKPVRTRSRAKPRELRLCTVCSAPFYMSGHHRVICGEKCAKKAHSNTQGALYKSRYRKLRLSGATAELARYYASHKDYLYKQALETLALKRVKQRKATSR